ncbi:DUF6338 family protein [Paenibacillus pasadenensis]|uniref:DUF6338 family protein n=1 Tax=Paenibacillus pasadenensis TaxID=217090 RepID=UPI001C60B5D1|nr:DUF6338 family protein [Paenibacillus pasadenensis]
MTLSSFDAVYYTFAFLVPGYLMFWVFSIFVPTRESQLQTAILRYLFFSCLNYALWSPLFYYLAKIDYSIHHTLRWFALMAGVVLLSPILLGMFFSWLVQQKWLRKMMFKVSKSAFHPIPTAWDYKMSNLSGSWAIVTLNDGSQVLGWYGSQSFSSSIAGERDLFLESVFQMDEDGAWIKRKNTEGIWIPANQIKWIEFFSDDKEVSNDE